MNTGELTQPFTHLMAKQRAQYWALQVFGWLGYGFFVELKAIFWEEHPVMQLSYAAMATLTGLVFSMLLRRWFHHVWSDPPLKRALLALVGVSVATALWSAIKMQAYFYQFEASGRLSLIEEFVAWYTYSFFIILSWAGLYFGIKYYRALLDEKEKTLKAISMAQIAQLKMLRYQLNPHFLFNTLNAISTLILEKETHTANAMVSQLSKFLRYSLDNDPMQKITLGQEVEALKLYLGIEQLRFEERLSVEIHITPEAEIALIPSLLLQPLIENAIKYAIAPSEQGGTISLSASIESEQLLLELLDDGPGLAMKNGKMPAAGVGLSNTRARLDQVYGPSHSFKIYNSNEGGLGIKITLPYDHA